MTTASCLCGAIRMRIDGTLAPIQICHCRSCQKAQGGAFAAITPVDAARVTVELGEEDLVRWASSPGKIRAFCRNCGSPMFSRREGQSELRFRVGVLDLPVDLPVASHAWCEEAAPWSMQEDHAPRYSGLRPA